MRRIKLKARLDAILARYGPDRRLTHDPLQFAHRYRDPADQEVVGFLAALYAYGNVVQILGTVEAILSVLGPRPAQFVKRFDPARDGPRFAPIGHRWTRGEDLAALLDILRHTLARHGSLRRLFLAGHDPLAPTIRPALAAFAHALRSIAGREARRSRGLGFFLADPMSGSPCKRWNLFLRWMVRRKPGLDLGLWPEIPPSKLVIPLDTHIARIGRNLRLTRRKSPSWAMAEEITRALARLDPADPLKYDFALCHFGISRDFYKEIPLPPPKIWG